MTSSPTALERLKAEADAMPDGSVVCIVSKADLVAVISAADALSPFASLMPSSLYSDKDNEGYVIYLAENTKRIDIRRRHIMAAKAALSRLTLPTTDGEKK